MKSRIKFSIRFLLIATLLFACSCWVHLVRGPVHQAIKALRARNAKLEFFPNSISWFHQKTGHYFDNVRVVDMSGLKTSDHDLFVISRLRTVEDLLVTEGTITDAGIKHLEELPGLKHLGLTRTYRFNDKAVDSLLKLRELRVLDLHDTNINGVGVAKLAELPKLQRFLFSAGSSAGGFSSETFDKLSSVPDVAIVGKAYLGGLNDKAIAQLAKMDTSRTRELMLSAAKFTDEGWRTLNQLRFRELDIAFTAINDRQLRILNIDHFPEIQFNFGKDWTKDEITIEGLSKTLDGRFDLVRIYQNEIDLFDSRTRSKDRFGKLVGKLRTKSKPLTTKQFQMWERQNVKEVILRFADNRKEHIASYRQSGTKIKLMIQNGLKFDVVSSQNAPSLLAP